MNEHLSRLMEDLTDRPAMLAQEFTGRMTEALLAGENMGRDLGRRTGGSFFHELAKFAPTRSDLFLEATGADPATDLNGQDMYGQTFVDILARKHAFSTLRELVDADRPIEIDSPRATLNGQIPAYRAALSEGPMSLVSAMHDFTQRMYEKGRNVGQIYPEQKNRFNMNFMHRLAERDDLKASDVTAYLTDLQFSQGMTDEQVKALLVERSHTGQTFFNQILERDPGEAMAMISELKAQLSDEVFDAAAMLRGDVDTELSQRIRNLPEDTIPALQLSKFASSRSQVGSSPEQLMEMLVDNLPAEDLHVKCTRGQTPLSIMAKNGWTHALRSALDKGVDPNFSVDGMTENPLKAALDNNVRPELIRHTLELLIAKDIDDRWLKNDAPDQNSPLKFAVDIGDHALVSSMLFAGADPNGHPGDSYSPLRVAIDNYSKNPQGYEPILNRLVFFGASLKRVDADMMTASQRLSEPGMAAARDYVHRLAVINQMSEQYGYEFAEAAVDGFSQEQSIVANPSVSLHTLQMIPGVNRALADVLKYESGGHERLISAMKVNEQSDPEIPAMDLIDNSRTLLSIPNTNRSRMMYEISKVRAATISLNPDQLSPDAIESYQNQVMSMNRLYSWICDSLGMEDTPQNAAELSHDHGRHLPRSFADFSDTLAASPLALAAETSKFPLRLENNGEWSAEVSLTRDQVRVPDTGKPISFLYGHRPDGHLMPNVESINGLPGYVMTPMTALNNIGKNDNFETGIVQFNNPVVITAENPLGAEPFPVDTQLLADMGYDGAVIYDISKGQVAGALDLSGRRMQIPNGVTVGSRAPEPDTDLEIVDLSADAPAVLPERDYSGPKSTPRRGYGL